MSLFPLKSSHKPVKDYHAALAQFQKHGHVTEGNIRAAFADLLKRCCSPYDWHLVEEYQFRGTAKQPLRAEGALIDQLTLQHGIWEAKDSSDDLQKEVKAKVAKGYPLTNTLFQSPDRAVLYQDSRIAFTTPSPAPKSSSKPHPLPRPQAAPQGRLGRRVTEQRMPSLERLTLTLAHPIQISADQELRHFGVVCVFHPYTLDIEIIFAR